VSNDAENTALITGINYILKYIKIENSYLFIFTVLNCNNFTILQFFCCII